MSSVTWRYLSGDTATFAVELSLVTDNVEDSMVDQDERHSWGALSIWIGGSNVCEHVAQGETLRSAHWYLLPIVEWLTDHWDPLLHEERLPLPTAGVDAARGVAHAAVVAELDAAAGRGIDAAGTVYSWSARHSLRFGAPGAILPDLYIRRYGDNIEFSAGADPVAGQDWGVVFTGTVAAVRIPVSEVAGPLFDAVESLVTVLRKRHPQSARYASLAEQITTLSGPSRAASRFAWISGVGDRVDSLNDLWRRVRAAIPEQLRQATNDFGTAKTVRGGLATLAPPAALLFGSLAPDVSAQDVVALYTSLLPVLEGRPVVDDLRAIGSALLSAWPDTGLSAGEQGSVYGEEAWRRIGRPAAARVPIHEILSDLGVTVDQTQLRDQTVRGVSMIGLHGTAQIVINRSFRLGTSLPVQRFTLAHELGHLLLDQDRATQMIVASGPWAPLDVERRANAFAAAFLMPIPVLDAAWESTHNVPTSDEIRRMAGNLAVSFSALVSRLQNIGRIAPEDAEVFRSDGVSSTDLA